MSLFGKYFVGEVKEDLVRYETHTIIPLEDGEVDIYAHQLTHNSKFITFVTIREWITEPGSPYTSCCRNLVSCNGDLLLAEDNVCVIRLSDYLVLTDYGIYRLNEDSTVTHVSGYIPNGGNIMDIYGKVFDMNSCFKTIKVFGDYLITVVKDTLIIYNMNATCPTSTTVYMNAQVVIFGFTESQDSYTITFRECDKNKCMRLFKFSKILNDVSLG